MTVTQENKHCAEVEKQLKRIADQLEWANQINFLSAHISTDNIPSAGQSVTKIAQGIGLGYLVERSEEPKLGYIPPDPLKTFGYDI